MRRMYFLAERNLAKDWILMRAQFSITRQTQKSWWSGRRYGEGGIGSLRFRSFIAVPHVGIQRRFRWRGGERRGNGRKARESNLVRSNVNGKDEIFHFSTGCEF